MREVDEAVRQDQAGAFAKKYGLPIGIAVVLVLVALGGFLFWQDRNDKALEASSEQLVAALDEYQAGNLDIADEELALIAAGDNPGAAGAAKMLRAAIALEQNRLADASALYGEVAGDAQLPQEMRDAATLRDVLAQFDTLEPGQVIERLGPLANEGSTYFASAAELVAHAHLAQGNEAAAGPLLVSIAKNEDAPGSLRERASQLAGLLGFDALEDEADTLEEADAPDTGSASGTQ